MTWKFESQRHALASRGIKTSINMTDVERNENYLSFHYQMDNHRGYASMNVDVSEEEIIKSLNDVDEIVGLTKEIFKNYPEIRNFYEEIPRYIMDEETYQNPYSNIIINIGLEDNFGMGSSSIGRSGFKVWWFIPELSKEELGNRMLTGIDLASTPAVAIPHEIQHTWGSHNELKQPLAEVVGTLFYLRNPEYCPQRQQEQTVGYLARGFLTEKYPQNVGKTMMNILYDYEPEMVDNILQKELHPNDYKIIKDVIS
ncbi:hypothetical protein AKJ51_01475 [candidate division MSBL1 archaeon SCGC-AAA382A20]|uniref:Uncharacterized protein n=1 Tax=candidate division MSBL1 archaeon SCGC-AAA382A20 TaxID=1698280 RepID=A0A133VLU6_9EURY|nr:hypothetical protein AKJ51_01475 [candidate division MSBL1 archaeon SCGC-AAA382A20]